MSDDPHAVSKTVEQQQLETWADLVRRIDPDLADPWNPPASDADIAELERRVGEPLPPSYRAFLRLTNGWNAVGPESIQPTRFFAAAEVRPIRELEPQFVQLLLELDTDPVSPAAHRIYGEAQDPIEFSTEYLSRSFAISPLDDGGLYLLSPDVKSGSEWEAWRYASWLPGAERFESFGAMVPAIIRELQEIAEEEGA